MLRCRPHLRSTDESGRPLPWAPLWPFKLVRSSLVVILGDCIVVLVRAHSLDVDALFNAHNMDLCSSHRNDLHWPFEDFIIIISITVINGFQYYDLKIFFPFPILSLLLAALFLE